MIKKVLGATLFITTIIMVYVITDTSRPDGSVTWIELSDAMSKIERNIISRSNSNGSLKYENTFLDSKFLPEGCYIQYLHSISEDKALITIEPAKIPYGRGRQILVGFIKKKDGKYKADIIEKMNWNDLQKLYNEEYWQIVQRQNEK